MNSGHLAPNPTPSLRTGWIPVALAGAWVLLLLAGMGILWRYKSTPGPRVQVLSRWPEASSIQAARGEPTLVVFVHPACPCTRATLSEISALLPRYAERLQTYVVCFRPADPPAEWSESSLLSALETMPQAQLVFDGDGREAARFGVQTSGHVLLYGRGGELRYSGGVCPARGHQGDNPGLDALQRALAAELAGGPPSNTKGAPVFGCSLLEPDSSTEEERP